MSLLAATLALCIASSWAFPAEIVQDVEGREYYLIPIEAHQRIRRQTTVEQGSAGSHVEHKQTLLENKNHKLDATVWAQRQTKNDPLTTGNKFDYLHKPSDSQFSIQTQNTRGQGTDAQASATYNFFRSQDKRGTIGISGDYSRHYGGPSGTSSPDYGVFLRGQYNFP